MWIYNGIKLGIYMKVITLSPTHMSSLNKAMSENIEDPSFTLYAREHEKHGHNYPAVIIFEPSQHNIFYWPLYECTLLCVVMIAPLQRLSILQVVCCG